MGKISEFFRDFKYRINCMKNGNIEEYKDYKASKKSKSQDIARYSEYVRDYTRSFESIKNKYSPDSVKYQKALEEANRWRYVLNETMLEREFIRPNSKEDIEYRERIATTYPERIKEAVSDNLNIRFHGTPIYFAKQILESGGITSSGDRFDGYIKSTDRVGEISVTTKNELSRTINYFSDISAYQRNLPCGAIFVVVPQKEDAEYEGQALMHNVDFKRNPDQLFAIISSPENIDNLKEWTKSAELPEDKVYEFEDFLNFVRKYSNYIDGQAMFKNQIINSHTPTTPLPLMQSVQNQTKSISDDTREFND